MARYEELPKYEKIKKEKNRLKRIFKDITENKKKTCEGLIDEASYMRATLFDLKLEIDSKGPVVEMMQGTYSIDRQNPALQGYNTMIKNYKEIIKQLITMLPEEKQKAAGDDGFEDFVEGRD